MRMLLRLGLVGPLGLAVAYATALTSDAPASASRATTSTHRTVDAPNCGREIANLSALEGAPMILLGELHGLEGVPAFAIDLACRLATSGKPVLLALEIPRQEQDRIDAFLASKGGAKNEASLLAGDFWRRPFQDGRSSKARLALLDVARTLRADGLPLRVVAVDDAAVPGAARDEAMASALLAARKPGEISVLLVGDLHARTKPGAPWNPNLVWAGVHLRAKEPKLVSLDNRYVAGEAWVCMGNAPSDCGIKKLKGVGKATDFRIERFAATDATGFDGMFDVGAATPSVPAREDMRVRR